MQIQNTIKPIAVRVVEIDGKALTLSRIRTLPVLMSGWLDVSRAGSVTLLGKIPNHILFDKMVKQAGLNKSHDAASDYECGVLLLHNEALYLAPLRTLITNNLEYSQDYCKRETARRNMNSELHSYRFEPLTKAQREEYERDIERLDRELNVIMNEVKAILAEIGRLSYLHI